MQFWQDFFDPNNQSKANRFSVGLKTMTLSTSTSGRNCIRNTYPIAVGGKEMERDEVEFYIKTELDKINGVSNEKPTFYPNGLK